VPHGVLRLKGLVQTGPAQWHELQFAGRRSSLKPCEAPSGGAMLVAIGLAGQLPLAALDALLAVPPS
jgi:hypothetical protein